MELQPNDQLVGNKLGWEIDGVVHVSPALYSLICSDDVREIKVVKLDSFDPTKPIGPLLDKPFSDLDAMAFRWTTRLR